MNYNLETSFDDDDDFCIEDDFINCISSGSSDEVEEKNMEFATEEYCKSKCEYYNTCLANYDVCLKKVFEDVLDTLSSREEVVIKQSFGYDGKVRTLEEIGAEFNVTGERILQIQAKALRKLRHPVRSRKFIPFDYDVFSIGTEDFYSRLLTKLFGIDRTQLFELNLGIDFAMVNEEKCSLKTPTQIKKQLERNIEEIVELTPYLVFLSNTNVVTLMQLLKTPYNRISLNSFNDDDRLYFEFINTIDSLGYQFKYFDPNMAIKEELSNKLKECIIEPEVYNEQILDLTLGTTLKLFEYRITNIGELVRNVNYLKRGNRLSLPKQQEIDEFLQSKKVALVIGNTKILYLSKANIDEFIDQFTAWMIKKKYSVNEFMLELKTKNINGFAVIEYICNLFPEFIANIDIQLSPRSIYALDFTIRTMNCLIHVGICTIEDLISNDSNEKIRSLGRRSLEEICEKLSMAGIDFCNAPTNIEDE